MVGQAYTLKVGKKHTVFGFETQLCVGSQVQERCLRIRQAGSAIKPPPKWKRKFFVSVFFALRCFEGWLIFFASSKIGLIQQLFLSDELCVQGGFGLTPHGS